MGVQVGRAVLDRIIGPYVPFQPLMKIPGLGNVDRYPLALFRLPGINIKAWQRLESGIQGEDLVGVLFPGLPGPVDRSRRSLFGLPVAAE